MRIRLTVLLENENTEVESANLDVQIDGGVWLNQAVLQVELWMYVQCKSIEQMHPHNFIMSYTPFFSQRHPTYNNSSTFTPFSQLIGGILGQGLLSHPLKNTLFDGVLPFQPMIHQQNNFISSNFNFSLGISDPLLAFSLDQVAQRRNSQILASLNQGKPPKRQEIIEISDDENPVDTRPITAVIKEKPALSVTKPTFKSSGALQFPKKQVIERKKDHINKQQLDSQIRRQARPTKKYNKYDSSLEESAIQKKKRISKQRFVYRLTEQQKTMMELSKYRDYRPDLIMVGPQFQANVDTLLSPKRELAQWLRMKREKLEMRKQV